MYKRQLIAIVAVTLIGSCYHASCFLGINRGAGDSRFVALVDMICGWFVVLPATALAAFVFHAPLDVYKRQDFPTTRCAEPQAAQCLRPRYWPHRDI